MAPSSGARTPRNYTLFLPPARGGEFVDSAYGTTITRLSDGVEQFKDAVHHEYATMSPFNCDNTRILLLTDNSGFLLVDRAGQVIASPAEVKIGGGAEPRWSGQDPNVFYFHEDNRLLQFDVASRRKSVLHTFTQFQTIHFGGGESDISEDGNHLLIVGDATEVGVYTLSRSSLGKTLNFHKRDFDYFDLTAHNNVIVRWGQAGTSRYQGVELFDQRMNFLRQVVPVGAHADRARDVNGDEVLVMLASNDTTPPKGCEGNGIEKIRLSDSRKTCLLPLNWNCEVHISANGRTPWALVSTTDTRTGTANAPHLLFPDWANKWQASYNELILVKLDGTQVRPVAHHRSRVLGAYWFAPRAALSRDGAFAVFDSNFGTKPLPDYTDVFFVQLQSPLPQKEISRTGDWRNFGHARHRACDNELRYAHATQRTPVNKGTNETTSEQTHELVALVITLSRTTVGALVDATRRDRQTATHHCDGGQSLRAILGQT